MTNQCCKQPQHLVLAILVSLGICAGKLNAQEVAKSEIVLLQDAQRLLCNQFDKKRSQLALVSVRTEAWERAEQVSQQLAKDPDNPELKRKMISSRAEFMYEKMKQLEDACKSAAEFDSLYGDCCKLFDAQFLDGKACIEQASQSESQELRFLADSLVQLKQIKAFLPSSTSSSEEFTAAEQRKLAEFNTALRQAEFQLEAVRSSKLLNNHHLAVLAQIKIQTAREYLGIKRAMAQAAQDRLAMAGVARNDLTALKILDDEARLAELQRRPAVEYSADSSLVNPSKIRYRFSEIVPQSVDETTSTPLTVDTVSRVEELLQVEPKSTADNKESDE